MKTVSSALIISFIVSLLSMPAYAARVDYDGHIFNTVDMSGLEIGNYGTITNFSHPDRYEDNRSHSNQNGFLPPHSKITITYTGQDFSFDPQRAIGVRGELYAPLPYEEKVFSAVEGLPAGVHPFDNGNALAPLVFAAANFIDVNTSRIYISNDSNYWVDFWALQIQQFDSVDQFTAYYSVTATPIPAALPMFLFLVVSMFGLRKLKKCNLGTASHIAK